MPYIIEVPHGYVKTGKTDTKDIKDAKVFATMKQARTFVAINCAGSPFKYVEVPDVKR
jgi:hypothetical protein